MKARRVWLVVLLASMVATIARSGHELPVYPSYYPHEIEIRTLPENEAAAALAARRIHAYVGSEPNLASAPPEQVRTVESLGAFVVVTINRTRHPEGEAACAVARMATSDLAKMSRKLILHPYPVTPLHGDYLHHIDLADAAMERLHAQTSAAANLKLGVYPAAAKLLGVGAQPVEGLDWDASVNVIEVRQFVASQTISLNGWLGPPWVRSGWRHAFGLLFENSERESERDDLDIRDTFYRLQNGATKDPVERINLERDLVRSLTAGCRRMVAGYVLKREYVNVEFSAGIENIGFDALDGLNSPNFIRTVKLKDFPWNGWLSLGIEAKPQAAWNPIAGFSDPFGRLLWSALGDPAAIPSPYDDAWMLNRISDIETAKGVSDKR